MKTVISLALVLIFQFADATQTTRSCKALLSAPQDELANSQRLSTLVMSEIKKTSFQTLALMKKQNPVLDKVCIGAGPVCAAASLVLGQTNLKSMVIEKSSTVSSNFEEKDFFINSIETDIFTMHRIPGLRIDFSQLVSGKYANSRQLAAYIQAAQYQSKVPVLLNTEITGIRSFRQGGQLLVALKTNHGFEITTRDCMIGTGLGTATTKVPTPSYRKLFQQSLQRSELDPTELQVLMNTETFMKAIKSSTKQNVVIPKTLAIVGDGDGARIALEELLESNVVLPEGFKIYVIGNNYQTVDEYVASRQGGDRYIERIVVHYEKKRVEGIPGYAIDAQLTPNGQLKFTVQDPKTKDTRFVEVEMAVDSTGYDNHALGMLKRDLGNISLVDVKGSLPERQLDQVNLARQVTLEDGTRLPIYMIGAASGPLLTAEQLVPVKNKNPFSIYNNVPTASEFVARLIGVEPFKRDLGERTSRPPVESAEKLFQILKK